MLQATPVPHVKRDCTEPRSAKVVLLSCSLCTSSEKRSLLVVQLVTPRGVREIELRFRNAWKGGNF